MIFDPLASLHPEEMQAMQVEPALPAFGGDAGSIAPSLSLHPSLYEEGAAGGDG